MKSPTPRQLAVLQAMAEFIAEHGYAPTTRELGRRFGFASTKAVDDHFYYMRIKGLVAQRAANKSRAWRITDLGFRLLGLPAPRPIPPKPIALPADGTVDVGQRCRRCEAMLFGGLHLCAAHRVAA